MEIFITILIVILFIWFAWKYLLPENVKDYSIGCIVVLAFVVFMLFQIVGIFQTCSSNDRYYERNPYEDPL